MKATYSTLFILALALFGLSCQNHPSGEEAVSFNQPFNIPFGQSVTLPDDSKLIFAQILNQNPAFRLVHQQLVPEPRVKVVLCRANEQKEDLVLRMGESLSLRHLGLGNIELRLLDLLSHTDGTGSRDPENAILRLALQNNSRP